jgi:CheY-like chemotaxis protein
MDPGQMQQVVMNLAVNSRDAMPQGGTLTLTTGVVEVPVRAPLAHVPAGVPPGVPPGEYVTVTVSDTGCGMDEATQSHLFEPFFTTKGVGRGTGLGLATVYGIIKASGGHIHVVSRPAQGTTFTIHLPRVPASAPPASAAVPSSPPPRERGTETVLIVEDEDMVRAVVHTLLTQSGYRVLEASQGQEALTISQQHAGPIHLLVTDVIMPQMSGRELAERLGQTRPEMKVLFVSGYTDDDVLRHGVREESASFLQKPFTGDALARKVREVLDH